MESSGQWQDWMAGRRGIGKQLVKTNVAHAVKPVAPAQDACLLSISCAVIVFPFRHLANIGDKAACAKIRRETSGFPKPVTKQSWGASNPVNSPPGTAQGDDV